MGGSEQAMLNEGHGEEFNFFRRYKDEDFFLDAQPFNFLPLPIPAPSLQKRYKNMTHQIVLFLQNLNPAVVVNTLLKLENRKGTKTVTPLPYCL